MSTNKEFTKEELLSLYDGFSKEDLIDIVINCNKKIKELEQVISYVNASTEKVFVNGQDIIGIEAG